MLTPKSYKKRLYDNMISEYLDIFGAVCIEGPKWCGKTWCGLNQANSVFYLSDPTDSFQNRRLAELDITSVLMGDRPRLIDEWQEVPSIWDAVRFEVDKEGLKGRFILTGSSTPNHKGILHSGTGRFGRIKLNTMSLYETGDSNGSVSLIQLFNENKLVPVTGPNIRLEDLIYFVVRGGWPGCIGYTEKEALKVSKKYLENVITEDMFKVDGIKRDMRKIRALIHSLGRNESTLVSNTTILNDIAEKDREVITLETISDYLSIFERLFLIENQESYAPKLRSSRRMLKSSKRHFVDPSLAVAALGATGGMLLSDLNTFGFLFEALCEHDLRIYAEVNEGKLFHLRDNRGNEVDAVIELEDGRVGLFEIKLGMNQVDEAAKNLIKVSKILAQEGTKPTVMAIIVGVGNLAYTREDGVHVIPIASLKN